MSPDWHVVVLEVYSQVSNLLVREMEGRKKWKKQTLMRGSEGIGKNRPKKQGTFKGKCL